MKKHLARFALLPFLSLLVSSIPAYSIVEITYCLELQQAGRWKATYEVSNSSYLPSIEWFTIFFDYGLYDHLAVETLPPLQMQWQEEIHNPLFAGPLVFPVYYDAQTASAGIAPGQTVGGFRVSFDWLGKGLPINGQQFEVYDLQSPFSPWIGTTICIPEPATSFIMFLGMLAVVARRSVLCPAA